ncbi:MAG: PEGA domain-containing protein [Myxococcota bacterium]
MRTYLIDSLILAMCFTAPSTAWAQARSENAEARVYFEEGNRLYQEAERTSDAERPRLLQRALEAYVDSLRIARSRNALFNAAVVSEELGRDVESFNYYSEYLRIEGLADADRQQAQARLEALRPLVAIIRIESVPGGAEFWIDRRDLAPLGVTPAEVAVEPGAHTLWLEREGFLAATRAIEVDPGEDADVAFALEATPAAAEPLTELPGDLPLEAPARRPRLRNAAIGTASGAVATAAVGLGLSIRARQLRNDYNDAAAIYEMTGDPDDLARANDLADRTDRFNIAADVMWGTTVALGVSAIVLYALHRKRLRQDRLKIDVTASSRGGFASATWQLGVRP